MPGWIVGLRYLILCIEIVGLCTWEPLDLKELDLISDWNLDGKDFVAKNDMQVQRLHSKLALNCIQV